MLQPIKGCGIEMDDVVTKTLKEEWEHYVIPVSFRSSIFADVTAAFPVSSCPVCNTCWGVSCFRFQPSSIPVNGSIHLGRFLLHNEYTNARLIGGLYVQCMCQFRRLTLWNLESRSDLNVAKSTVLWQAFNSTCIFF